MSHPPSVRTKHKRKSQRRFLLTELILSNEARPSIKFSVFRWKENKFNICVCKHKTNKSSKLCYQVFIDSSINLHKTYYLIYLLLYFPLIILEAKTQSESNRKFILTEGPKCMVPMPMPMHILVLYDVFGPMIGESTLSPKKFG